MNRWIFAGVLWPALACAAGAPPPDLTLTDAWVEPSVAGNRTFLHAVLTNATSVPVTVTGVASPVGETAKFQLYHKDTRGLLQIDPLPSMVMAPHGSRVVVPGALELQISGLKTDLEEGTEIPLVLTTETTTRTYRVPVGRPLDPATETLR